MSWLQTLRNKPHHQKIRLIWTVIIITVIALIVVWIFTSRIGENSPKDTSLFKTFGNGLKDVREQYNK